MDKREKQVREVTVQAKTLKFEQLGQSKLLITGFPHPNNEGEMLIADMELNLRLRTIGVKISHVIDKGIGYMIVGLDW